MWEAIMALTLVFEGVTLTGKSIEQPVTHYLQAVHPPCEVLYGSDSQINYNQTLRKTFFETHEKVNGEWKVK